MNIKLSILFFLIPLSFLGNGNPNPESWFESQYTDAIEYCKHERMQIDKVLSSYNIDSKIAMSVVFPEMLRYTLWKDFFETKALEILYVDKGKEGADFSIGWMQMKPSFAEKVERMIHEVPELRSKYNELCVWKSIDELVIREKRVTRLKSFEWQLRYLSAFIDLVERRIGLANLDEEQKILYLAATYNRGLSSTKQELLKFSRLKTFPYGPGKDNQFSYVELAVHFYNKESSEIFR